jgi:hypothetical protein
MHTLVPKFPEMIAPMIGAERYIERQLEEEKKMREENRGSREINNYGTRAVIISNAMLIYHSIVSSGLIGAGFFGLTKLLEK